MGGIPCRGRTAPVEVEIEISEQNQRCGDQGAGSHQQDQAKGLDTSALSTALATFQSEVATANASDTAAAGTLSAQGYSILSSSPH